MIKDIAKNTNVNGQIFYWKHVCNHNKKSTLLQVGFEYFAEIFIHRINLQQNSWKYLWRYFIFSKAAGLKPATLLKTEQLYSCSRILLIFSVIIPVKCLLRSWSLLELQARNILQNLFKDFAETPGHIKQTDPQIC